MIVRGTSALGAGFDGDCFLCATSDGIDETDGDEQTHGVLQTDGSLYRIINFCKYASSCSWECLPGSRRQSACQLTVQIK